MHEDAWVSLSWQMQSWEYCIKMCCLCRRVQNLFRYCRRWFQQFYSHQMSSNEDHSTDTTLSKYVWEVTRKVKKNVTFLTIPIQMNCLIKDQSLFHSATTLTSFYCLIINQTIRPSQKCPIRNIWNFNCYVNNNNFGNCQLIVK